MAARTQSIEVSAIGIDFQIDKGGYVRCAECLNEEKRGEIFHLCEGNEGSLEHYFNSYDVETCDFCGCRLWDRRYETVTTATVEHHGGAKIF